MTAQQIIAMALFLAQEGPELVNGFLALFKEHDQDKLKDMLARTRGEYDEAFAESQNL